MADHQQAVVQQEPTETHPEAEVVLNDLNYEFASVFKQLFPDIQCPHCYTRFRLLFIAGVLASERTGDQLTKIGSPKAMLEAATWWQTQVVAGDEELRVELRVEMARTEGCYHDETEGYH